MISCLIVLVLALVPAPAPVLLDPEARGTNRAWRVVSVLRPRLNHHRRKNPRAVEPVAGE